MRYYQLVGYVPAIDHKSKEIISMELDAAVRSPDHTPVAINALENAGKLGQIGFKIPQSNLERRG